MLSRFFLLLLLLLWRRKEEEVRLCMAMYMTYTAVE